MERQKPPHAASGGAQALELTENQAQPEFPSREQEAPSKLLYLLPGDGKWMSGRLFGRPLAMMQKGWRPGKEENITTGITPEGRGKSPFSR